MSNLEQKVGTTDPLKQKPKTPYNQITDDLGLDSDHSSDGAASYDNDNDRISHNPDGEDDDHDTTEEPGHSPLMDK